MSFDLRTYDFSRLTLCTGNFISISLAAAPDAFKRFIWNLLELKNKNLNK